MKLGIEGKLQYKAAGIATGEWVDVPDVTDVTLNLGTTEATSVKRGTGRVQATKTVAKVIAITFTAVWTKDNAPLISLLDAYLDHSMRGIQALDEDDAGFQFDAVVTDWQRNEPIEGQPMTVSVTMKATDSVSPPAKVIPS